MCDFTVYVTYKFCFHVLLITTSLLYFSLQGSIILSEVMFCNVDEMKPAQTADPSIQSSAVEVTRPAVEWLDIGFSRQFARFSKCLADIVGLRDYVSWYKARNACKLVTSSAMRSLLNRASVEELDAVIQDFAWFAVICFSSMQSDFSATEGLQWTECGQRSSSLPSCIRGFEVSWGSTKYCCSASDVITQILVGLLLAFTGWHGGISHFDK